MGQLWKLSSQEHVYGKRSGLFRSVHLLQANLPLQVPDADDVGLKPTGRVKVALLAIPGEGRRIALRTHWC